MTYWYMDLPGDCSTVCTDLHAASADQLVIHSGDLPSRHLMLDKTLCAWKTSAQTVALDALLTT